MCGDYAYTGHDFVNTAFHPKSMPKNNNSNDTTNLRFVKCWFSTLFSHCLDTKRK